MLSLRPHLASPANGKSSRSGGYDWNASGRSVMIDVDLAWPNLKARASLSACRQFSLAHRWIKVCQSQPMMPDPMIVPNIHCQ